MKIIETLTLEDKINLLNGSTVGFFPNLILSTDSFFSQAYNLCLGYYMNNSSNKTVSPIYEKELYNVVFVDYENKIIKDGIDNKKSIYQITIENKNSINKSVNDIVAQMIRGKFIDKWERYYNALINENYEILEDIVKNETSNYTKNEVNNYTKNETSNYAKNETKTYNNTINENGKTNTDMTTSSTNEKNNDVYGFNSTAPVGSDLNYGTDTENVKGDKEKNTTENVKQKTGSDTNGTTGNDEKGTTGNDDKDTTKNETISRTGRNTSAQDLLQKELDFRSKNLFFNIVFRDIDSIIALEIYDF